MTAAQTEILSDQRGYRKTAGERLRRARELKGLSQKDVANALNLMVSHVRAIESNRYDSTAEGEHFGGYLRSYARLVDLDPQQIIDLYASQSDDSGADTIVLSPVQLASQQQSQFKPGTGISIGFFAVVCLAVAVWVASRFGVFGGDEELSEGASAQQEAAAALQEGVVAAAEPLDTPVPAVSEPEREPVAEIRKPAILERPATSDKIAESVSPAKTSAAAPDIAATGSVVRNVNPAEQASSGNDRRDTLEPMRLTPAAAARQRRERLAAQNAADRATNASQATLSNINIQQRATRTNRQSSRGVDREADRRVQSQSPTLDNNVVSVSGSDQLVLDFSTDCWVEIYDANGAALRLGVEPAGERLMLRGKAPFDVLVGFSRGVKMTLNGEPVPIKQHQFSDSTQLVVGGPEDFFGTQQTYDDATAVAASESKPDELDYVDVDYPIDDSIDEQVDDRQAVTTQTTDEDSVEEEATRKDEQAVDATPEQLAAAGKRVDFPARYSRQFATPAPSTVDELEMAARQINTSKDDATDAYNSDEDRRGGKTSLVTKQDELQFTFSAECWVEVYDVEKRPLVMDTKYAGETLELKGQGPFEVRVGNSRAVSLKVNGQKIEIKRDRYIGSTEFFVGSR